MNQASDQITQRNQDIIIISKMTSLTEEWQLKVNENSIKYIIDIEDFDQKIRNFSNGEEIYSKYFKVGSSTFQISISPVEDDNYVGVYLKNRSNWRVKAKCSFSIQEKDFEKDLPPQFFTGGSRRSRGFSQFISHSRCEPYDVLTCKGNLILQADVEILEEEVLPDRDLTVNETTKKLENKIDDQTREINRLYERNKNIERKVDDQTKEIKRLCEKNNIIESENQIQINELKNMISDLSIIVMTQQPQQHQTPIHSIMLECPVCMEAVRPPMRLKQCGQGHIICDSCYDQAGVEADSQRTGVNICHTCRGFITGRPSQLERILGLC